ncbi:MAG: hypothetical protein K6D95_06215 [Treponema sp.]|nr:hypothetical protein [Treponema sp.]
MRVKSSFYLILVLFAFITFPTCTIGLGSAVDTQAPTIDISYPPANASVKGEFLLSGTWSDDRGLKEILVEVYKNKDSEPCDTAYATINSNKTWTLTLNREDEKSEISDSEDNGFYQGWKYSDGEYQIQVTASDNGGHTSQTAKTTLNIDNTPPVLILTKPTSVGENTAKSYGQTVQLEGTFSEATDKTIDNLTVTFYDSTGNALFDSEFTGITDMSNANPLVIAQYYSEAAEPSDSDSDNYIKWENYKKLYSESEIAAYRTDPTTSIDTKQFYFSVTASDQAREYTNTSETEGSGQGNTTRYYYRGTSDMLTLVNGKNLSFSNFSVAMLQNYLNKTDETYQDNSALESILSAAQSVSVESGLKSDGSARSALSAETTTDSIADCINNTNTSQGNVYLNFSINPKNNPTFEVSKMSLADSTSKSESQYTDGYYKYLTETTLHVSLNPGLDNTNLDTPTVSIYYVKNGSTEKQLLWTWDEDVALAYAKKQTALASQSDAYILGLLNTDSETYRYTKTAEDENSDGLSVDTTLSTKNKEIIAGSKYTIIVEGYDIESQAFVAKDIAGYGFIATSNSTVPDIDFGSESGTTNLETSSTIKASVVEGNNLKFTGYVESGDELSDDESLYYTITIKDNSDSSKTKTVTNNITGSDKVLQNGSQYIYDWSFTFEPDSDITDIIDNGSGFYKISVDVYATNGGGTAHIGRNYYLDTQNPEIPIVTVSSGYTDKTKTSVTIYLNNTNTFTLSGTTTDNFIPGITSAVFTGKDSDGNTKTLTKDSSSGDITWEFTDVDLSGFAVQDSVSDVILTVSAKDSGGNEASVSYNLEFDTTAPAGYHLYDKLNKDLIFRVGEYDNTSADVTAAGATWDDNLDEDVGGKYSTGTWGTSQTITVRGDFVEEDSGLKMIYYKIFDEAPDADAIDAFESNYASDYTGMISPLTGDDVITRRVLYTKADGSKGYKEVNSSFKAALSGFKNKNNYLLLLAVDNVGNVGLDTLEGTNINDSSIEANIDWNTPQNESEGISSISLNVDTDAPDVSSTTSGTQYTNKVSKITVEGSAEDTDSGLASVVIKIIGKDSSGNALEKEISATGTDSWSADITTDNLKDLVAGNTYSVKAVASDNAGNTTSSEIFKLKVDTTAPSISLTSPANGSTVNESISISGKITAGDGAQAESLTLYYSATEPTSSTKLSDLTQFKVNNDANTLANWEFDDFDSYVIFGTDTSSVSKIIYIIPVVTDTAGNCSVYTETTDGTRTYSYEEGTNYFKYTVDRDSDRPVIRLTGLNKLADGSYILKYGTKATLEGQITDDDSNSTSVINKLYITEDEVYTGSGTAPTEVTVDSNGSFTYTPSDYTDGEKTLYFYIKDNTDTEFYTGNSVSYLMPKEQFKSETAADNSSAITYRSDSTSPSISNTLVQAYYDSDDSEKVESGSPVAPGVSLYLGGSNKKYGKFVITGYDANGIEGMRLTLNYKNSEGKDDTYKIASVEEIDFDSVEDNGDFTEDGSVADNTDDPTKYVWTTGYIDFSSWTTGNVTGTIEVYDKSGLKGNSSPTFYIDNDGPSATITSPSLNEEKTGEISFAGSAGDSGTAGLAYTAWLIPSAEQQDDGDAELFAATDSEGNSIWNSTYDSGKSAATWQFTLSSETLAAYDNEDYYTAESNDVYTLPFYILTVDNLGNYTIKKDFYFRHNPNADRPKTEISYPNDSNYKTDESGNIIENYVTLGGSIRISGTAIIPSNTTTVDSVYLQIAKGSGNLGEDEDFSKKYTVDSDYAADDEELTVMTKAEVQSALGKTLTFADDFDWGIKADRTSSWNITINKDGDFDPEDEGAITYIAIRACAINAEGKVGSWTDWYYLNIDNTAPTLSPMLYQFSTAPTAGCEADTVLAESNILATTSYSTSSEMYLKGDWYLVVKLYDESELKSYTVFKTIAGSSTEVTPVASKDPEGSGEKTQYLFIKVDTSVSSVAYKVTASDSDHAISDTYTLYIDNDAPELTSVYKGSTYNEANLLSTSIANVVQDSSYIYTLGGKVTENASGFERLAFYYVRAEDIDGTDYDTEVILDPLITSITSGTDASKAKISELTARPFTQDTNTYYLYSKEVAGSLGTDGYTFTATSSEDITDNPHIREGGLIEVGGLLRRINTIDGATITFDSSTGTKSEALPTTAYFPYAQIIDNTATEKVTDSSGVGFIFQDNSDDGDGLPETLTGSKSTGFTWDATIHSSNMADGPCSLVVLAFDKAGNVSGATYPVKVENSAPRLAKVFLGTDLNSSGSWDANEFEGYDIYNANKTYGVTTTEVKAAQTISTGDYGDEFTIKDKLAVVAEIVGGNGDIIMVYGKDAASTSPVKISGTGAGASADANTDITSLVSTSSIGKVSYNNASVSTSLKGFTLTNEQLVGTVEEDNDGDGIGKSASFTFWDHTDELDAGTTSQNCVLLVNDFTIDLVDSVPPKVVVNPFYWESSSVNSLYANSTSNGHIELEKDLTDTTAATSYGTDPKVSGKITFTGTAYDDHAIKSLAFTFADFADSGEVSMASYDPTSTDETYVANGGWSALSGNSGSTLADGGKYEWTISTAENDSSRYYDDTAYLGQSGHKIYWTVSVDTAQIADVAKLDQTFTVKAYDGKSYSTAATASAPDTSDGAYIVTDGTTHVPSYQMDVVPYIMGVKTSLSTLKKNNPSVYDRTALGHYPVAADETVSFTGFNLGSSTSVDISTLTKSGSYDFTVNGIKSVNNINNNNAKGSYEGEISVDGSYAVLSVYAYNRQPNNDNNNRLDDDIVFDIWEFNSQAARPISGLISDPVMKINPATGVIGFAFTNGPLYFSMPGTVSSATENRIAKGENSYAYWQGSYDFMSSIAFTYDSDGHTYGVAAGGDINSTQADRFSFMTDRWGLSGQATGGSYDGSNALRLEAIAQYGDSSLSNTGTLNFDKNRVKSPSIVTSRKNTTNATNIYMAYFDDLNEEIRFRYGNLKDTQTTKANFNNFNDAYRNKTMSSGDNLNNGKYSTTYCQIIADSAGTATLGQAGEYVAIDVVSSNSKDVVVLVWYDSYEGNLMYAYNNNPTAATTGKNKTNWAGVKTIFTGAGEYCQIKADGNGGIHIAAYDGTNGDVRYAYLSKFDSDYDEEDNSCVVDSYAIIGQNLTIDVVLDSDGTTPIPYIGYYGLSSARPKVAYKIASGINSGSDSITDSYTGNWEVSLIPTASRVPQDRINVALWKTSEGKKTSVDSATSTAGQYFGTCYGNGTSNPVLGYQIKESSTKGYIETAQMR